ncbi:MAG: glycosyltransferase, partial [Bacteroidota bacterium]
MAKEFAKSHRVFYINHPYSIKDYFSELQAHPARKTALRRGQVRYEQDEQMPDQFYSVIPPLTLPVNKLPKSWLYRTAAAFNHRQLHHTVRQIIKDHQVKHYLYLNCFDPFFAPILPPDLNASLYIYQCVDDISQNQYTARHGTYLEEKAIAAADLTLVTSKELFRLKSPLTPNIHILNNAADTSNFQKALHIDYPKPQEIAAIKGKIIGYIGNLDELRVNYPLLKQVALAHPDKTLVLVGPINNSIYQEIGLDQLPNVRFTGGKSIEALPPYLRYFDCTIIPFHCNTLTKSIYPLKINEYLAAGKAVVATNFSPDIESFR